MRGLLTPWLVLLEVVQTCCCAGSSSWGQPRGQLLAAPVAGLLRLLSAAAGQLHACLLQQPQQMHRPLVLR